MTREFHFIGLKKRVHPQPRETTRRIMCHSYFSRRKYWFDEWKALSTSKTKE